MTADNQAPSQIIVTIKISGSMPSAKNGRVAGAPTRAHYSIVSRDFLQYHVPAKNSPICRDFAINRTTEAEPMASRSIANKRFALCPNSSPFTSCRTGNGSQRVLNRVLPLLLTINDPIPVTPKAIILSPVQRLIVRHFHIVGYH